MIFDNIFDNKKVLITGHTGFKGSWLSLWLTTLGAKVYGISNNIPTNPSHFKLLEINFTEDFRFDISNTNKTLDSISNIKPDYIFHLAAQPLVSESFKDPLYTFKTNTIGTANILESVRQLKNKCIVVMITSDKSYDNLEIKRGYHEDDKLGGSDPYSGSKGAAELVINSYVKSYYKDGNIRIAVGRAGNVIGGGDWAKDRIIPDIIRSLNNNEVLKIRSPKATRPWQHVLEPLSGYLTLAYNLSLSESIHGQAFNFGPPSRSDYNVEQVLSELKKYFQNLKWDIVENKNFKESQLLKLDCSKAKQILNWESSMSFKQTIQFTSEWYNRFMENSSSMKQFSIDQIKYYSRVKEKRNKK
tara:strand:+ start:2627 stop:3700 length:1074 start_codon:yes stop_codon:yes gene_type:complete